jgi:hypothetical protein
MAASDAFPSPSPIAVDLHAEFRSALRLRRASPEGAGEVRARVLKRQLSVSTISQ